MSGYDYSAEVANALLEAADHQIEELRAEIERLHGPMIEEAKAYMRETWGPCLESEDRDRWHERLGMLVDFIHGRFSPNIAVSGGLPATGKTYTGRAGSVKEEA